MSNRPIQATGELREKPVLNVYGRQCEVSINAFTPLEQGLLLAALEQAARLGYEVGVEHGARGAQFDIQDALGLNRRAVAQ